MAVHEVVEDHIAEVIVESPPVNAFSVGDLRELKSRFRSYEDRPDVHVAILRSQGRGFNAGGDIKEILSLTGADGLFGQSHGTLEATVAIHDCAVPVIAAVHGYCIGNGMLMIGSCDAVIAAEGTKFIFAEVDNGSVSGAIHGLALLPEKRLRVAMYTCEPISAEELQAHGAIHRIVPAAELVDAARDLARTIAGKDPGTIRRAKATINGAVGRDLRAKYRQELGYSYELKMLGRADEVRQAFVDGERGTYDVNEETT